MLKKTTLRLKTKVSKSHIEIYNINLDDIGFIVNPEKPSW
jgi:hypothetical protein